MTIIKRYVENIEEELEGAQHYAEKYVESKARGELQYANQFKEMANDELKHAMYIHEHAVKEVAEISKVYTPPVDMLDKWEHAHKKYIEKVATIRQVLGL